MDEFTFQITDFLFSPMVLMMILPLLLMLILPKMMNDPETKKEMENLNLNKMTSDMPDVSEMITSWFSPKPPPAPTGSAIKNSEARSKVQSKPSKKRN